MNAHASAKAVLFISSYSETFETVDLQKQGIHSVFDSNDIQLDIEYMDTKHFSSQQHTQLFHDMLAYKLTNRPRYDAVLLGDDAALHFAQEYQSELFKDIPMVFFCINNVEYAQSFKDVPDITGAVEEFYLHDTIDVAVKFQPGAKNLIAIVDNTLTGKGDQDQFYALRKSYPSYNLSQINTSEYTHEQLAQRLENIGMDSIIFFLDFFEDADGCTFTIPEGVSFITQHCTVPVYRTSTGGVGSGLLGGKMVSYEDSGRTAAELVLAVLNGKPIKSLPILTKGSSQYCFDYNVLKRFNIPVSLVPKGSVIINRRISFFERHKMLILPASFIILFLLSIVLAVLYDNLRQRKFRKELQEYTVQLKEKEDRISYQAEHDYLSDLLNRRSAMDRLDILIKQKKDVTVMLMDIDNFKGINDTYGHSCGDAILSEIGKRFSEFTKREDDVFVSRFGGDEFLIVFPDANEDHVLLIINRIRDLFALPVQFENRTHYIKTSIGISSAKKGLLMVNELVSYADLAMYSVKKSGKNSYAFYDEKMKAELIEYTGIETMLNEACRNDGFTVVYQPQVDTEAGTIHSYEALVRFKDSRMTPAQFIPVAEETNIIQTIGRIVTKKVVEQLVRWRTDGLTLHPVAINFSSNQIRDTGYVEFLRKLLEENNIAPSLIEIEITESIFLGYSDRAMKLFTDFFSIGVSLTLDDFGTGYSSINYLTYIPVSKIKLDKSLIDIYLQDGKDEFVHNIIRLSHCLGLKITVEGVESKTQYERLRQFSCDYIQGYYFSKPVSGTEIEHSAFR